MKFSAAAQRFSILGQGLVNSEIPRKFQNYVHEMIVKTQDLFLEIKNLLFSVQKPLLSLYVTYWSHSYNKGKNLS